MSLPLASGTWTLDPAHSQVGFGLRHLGISTITGRFNEVEATLEVGDDAGSSRLSATIQMASVDTGNADRNGHLLSTDFFDAETGPVMTFESSSISGDDESWTVSGDLNLNGHSQTVDLAVTFFGSEDNPFDGTHRAGFRASGQIDRTAFGIDWQVPLSSGGVMLATMVDLHLDVQLVAPAAE